MKLTVAKSGLILSNILLSLSVLSAFFSPATTYEVSIYDSTPIFTWIFLTISLIILAYVAVHSKNNVFKLSLISIFFVPTIFLFLPLIRGYYFYGMGDTLTHIGWIKDLLEGTIDPLELRYSIHHVGTIIVYELTELNLYHSLYLFSVSIILSFIPISYVFGQYLTGSTDGAVISMIAACTLFPVLNIGAGNINPQPTAQAAFYFLVPIYLFHQSIDTPSVRNFLLLYISVLALLLMHPHRIVHLILYLLGVLIVVIIEQKSNIMKFKLKLIFAFMSSVIVLFWTRSLNSLARELANNITGIFLLLQGVETESDPEGETVFEIISSIDINLFDLYLRIFLVPTLFMIFSFVTILFVVSKWPKDISSVNAKVLAGTIIQIPFFFFAFAGGIFLTMRNLPQILVLGVITGSVGIYVVLSYSPQSLPHKKTVVVAILIFCVVLSGITVYTSPTIIKPNQQITEASYTGYETSLDHWDEETHYSTLRIPVSRYKHTIYGTEVSRDMNVSGVPPSLPRQSFIPSNMANQNLSNEYNDGQYISITRLEKSYYEEIINFRHYRDDFVYLENSENINRLYYNGDFELYKVTR